MSMMIMPEHYEKVMERLGVMSDRPPKTTGSTLIKAMPEDPLFDKLLDNEEYMENLKNKLNELIYNSLYDYYAVHTEEFLHNLGIPVTLLQKNLFKDLTQ